ncbi:MAG: hypothetical protein DRN30_05470 [Thermoplasmata archaeon]|nr:MAG: hypothetical protein DRN30_05470 [Thermoplasmata archaeon]
MRAVKRPNFNKERSKAILLDGKRFYVVNVEISDYDYSFVDYINGKICLRENSPDLEAEFYHEDHHLYCPLSEPIWTPTLPTLADKSLNSLNDECIIAKIYADEDVRRNVIKTLIRTIKPKRDKKSRITVETFKALFEPVVTLGRFDNIFEDVRIHDHLVKRHRISEDRLKVIEQDAEFVYYGIRCVYERLKDFYDWIPFLEKFYRITEPLVRKGVYSYGYVFYPIFDKIICKMNDWKLTKYYDLCIRSLKDAKKFFNSRSRGIFKITTLRRINLELFRVTLMRKALEIPVICHDLSYLLALNGTPINEIEHLLDVKILKGFRDPLAVLKNGEIVTWYKTYKINGIKTDNNVVKDVFRRLLARRTSSILP